MSWFPPVRKIRTTNTVPLIYEDAINNSEAPTKPQLLESGPRNNQRCRYPALIMSNDAFSRAMFPSFLDLKNYLMRWLGKQRFLL